MTNVSTLSTELGAVATSLKLTPHDVLVQWAAGFGVAIGLLALGMVVVWSVRTVVRCVWESVTGGAEGEGGKGTVGGGAQALHRCECLHCSPQVQIRTRGQKLASVCRIRTSLEELDAAVTNLHRTRAILTEIMATSAMQREQKERDGLDPSTTHEQ